MDKLKDKAIDLLEVIYEIGKKYDKINESLRKLDPEFPARIRSIDTDTEVEVVKLIDHILGGEWGSYFLYECADMKDGGLVVDGGKEYKIKTVEDLRKYIKENKSNNY